MRIDVTAEDIRDGEKRDNQCCMVALAVRRAAARPVYVGTHWLQFSKDANRLHPRQILPAYVTEAIQAFDAGDKVGPFSFDIEDLPAETEADAL